MYIDSIEEKLASLPVTEAWIGATYGCFAVRFGPYPPEKVGEFLTRLMDEHKGRHPFFFTLQCAPAEDPVPMLLDLAKDEAEGARRRTRGK